MGKVGFFRQGWVEGCTGVTGWAGRMPENSVGKGMGQYLGRRSGRGRARLRIRRVSGAWGRRGEGGAARVVVHQEGSRGGHKGVGCAAMAVGDHVNLPPLNLIIMIR